MRKRSHAEVEELRERLLAWANRMKQHVGKDKDMLAMVVTVTGTLDWVVGNAPSKVNKDLHKMFDALMEGVQSN